MCRPFVLAAKIKKVIKKTVWNSKKSLRDLKAMAGDMTFYISLPDKPVYLKPGYNKAAERLETATENSGLATARFATLCVIDPSPSVEPGDVLEDADRFYVRSSLSVQSLFRCLVEQNELSSRFEFVLGTKIFSKTVVGRQLYALGADDASNTADNSILSQAQKHEYSVWMYKKDTNGSEPSTVWRLTDCRSKNNRRTMPDTLVEDVEIQQISPIFQEYHFSPVFHDYERAMKVLNMYKDSIEVQELFEIAAQKLGERKTVAQLQSMMKEPLIVVEGMDATGKTTLTQFLEEKLNAARHSTPPPCLLPLRRFFDKLPEIVRRAYYSLGNYIVAQQIAVECQTRAVVMDRYWHSTAAYGIANETSLDDLPSPGHGDYCWPADLLKPSAVIFLTVSEQVRRERLGNRQDDNITFEERSLNKDELFRKRLCEAYLRMREPACIQVDSSGSKEHVVEAVLKQIELQGIHLE